VTKRAELSKDLAEALDKIGAEVIHVGIFDYAGMFRERRLRRQELLDGAGRAVFANVVTKWDTGENIVFPGPYRSETVRYDVESLRPYPFEAKAAALVMDYTGPQAEIMPRRVLQNQIAKARDMGFDVQAAYEFEFIVLAETAESLRAKSARQPLLVRADGGNACWPDFRTRGLPCFSGCFRVFAQCRIGSRLHRSDTQTSRRPSRSG
jgi:glutamine synthetase